MDENLEAYIIRKAEPTDAPILAEAERTIARIPGQLASKPEELKDEAFLEKIIALSKSENGIYVVVEKDGAPVGHAILAPHKLAVTKHVVVLTIAIHKGHQGSGLGKRLMQYLIAWARNNPKVEKFELQVRSTNERAIKLYKGLGFLEEGRKTKRLKYGPDQYVDDIYMALWVGLE